MTKPFEDIPSADTPTPESNEPTAEISNRIQRFKETSRKHLQKALSDTLDLLDPLREHRREKLEWEQMSRAGEKQSALFVANLMKQAEQAKESMPNDLKEKLEKITLKGSEYDDHGKTDYEAKGLEMAISLATSCGAGSNYDISWANTWLTYNDGDTEVEVSAVNNGWSVSEPEIMIKHKGKEYSWIKVSYYRESSSKEILGQS